MANSASPRRPKPAASDCSIAAAASILGDRWSLLILRELFRGNRRFGEMHTNLGIAKNLLSTRLRSLIEAGVIDRVPYQQAPVRYEYRLTEKGSSFSPVLIALMHWGDRWYAEQGAPVELVHRNCGHPLQQAVTCPSCERDLRPGEIGSRPGSHNEPDLRTSTNQAHKGPGTKGNTDRG